MNELNQVCYYQYNDELLFINNIIFNCDIKNENNIIIKNIILLVPLIIDSSCCTNKYNENAANKNTIHTIENCNDNAMIFIYIYNSCQYYFNTNNNLKNLYY